MPLQQATFTVKEQLLEDHKAALVLMAIDVRNDPDSYIGEVTMLATKIGYAIKNHELLTVDQRLALADYIIEYHTDLTGLATELFAIIDNAARRKG